MKEVYITFVIRKKEKSYKKKTKKRKTKKSTLVEITSEDLFEPVISLYNIPTTLTTLALPPFGSNIHLTKREIFDWI